MWYICTPYSVQFCIWTECRLGHCGIASNLGRSGVFCSNYAAEGKRILTFFFTSFHLLSRAYFGAVLKLHHHTTTTERPKIIDHTGKLILNLKRHTRSDPTLNSFIPFILLRFYLSCHSSYSLYYLYPYILSASFPTVACLFFCCFLSFLFPTLA